jgi:hypothetical protein
MPSTEDIDHQLDLLRLNRQTLIHYIKQRVMLGEEFEPPSISHGIKNTQDSIASIKKVLRSWNIRVEDLPNDAPELNHEKYYQDPSLVLADYQVQDVLRVKTQKLTIILRWMTDIVDHLTFNDLLKWYGTCSITTYELSHSSVLLTEGYSKFISQNSYRASSIKYLIYSNNPAHHTIKVGLYHPFHKRYNIGEEGMILGHMIFNFTNADQKLLNLKPDIFYVLYQ